MIVNFRLNNFFDGKHWVREKLFMEKPLRWKSPSNEKLDVVLIET